MADGWASSLRRPWPIGVGLSCIFEGALAARFHKLVVVIEVAGERQVLFYYIWDEVAQAIEMRISSKAG